MPTLRARVASFLAPAAKTATVTSLVTTEEYRERRKYLGASPEQQDIRRYDAKGPGFVGWYLDARAQLGAMVKGLPALDGEPITPDSEAPEDVLLCAAVVRRTLVKYKNPSKSMPQNVYAHCRAVSGVGECLIGNARDYGWVVVQTPATLPRGDKVFWRGPDGVERELLGMYRSHVENQAEGKEWEAYSPLYRALPEIDRYRDAVHAQVRPLNSRQLMNGLVRFPSANGDIDHENAMKKVVSDMLLAAANEERERGYMTRGRRDAQASIPYPFMAREKPDWIDLGRNTDPAVMDMEMRALDAFGRAVGMPLKLLVEGPGTAKFSNEDHLMVSYLTQDIQPMLDVVWGDIWHAYLRPALLEIRKAHASAPIGSPFRALAGMDVDRWSIVADAKTLIVPPDRAADLVDAFVKGIGTRAAAAKALNTELMPIPDEMDEYEHWAATRSVMMLPGYAEAAQDNAAAQVTGQAVGEKAAEQIAPEKPAPLPPAPKAPGLPAVGGPPVRLPAKPAATPAVRPSPALEPVKAAALPHLAAPSRDGEAKALARSLASIDRTANRAVADWIAAASDRLRTRVAALAHERHGIGPAWETPDTSSEAVKEAIRKLPKGDPLREQARTETDNAAVIALIAASIDWPALGAEAAAGLDTSEVDRIMARAGADVNAVVGSVPAPDHRAAAAVALTAVLTWFDRQLLSPTVMVPPTTAATSAMMAAGGALVDGDGFLALSPDRQPIIDGVRWQGGTGYATGHHAVASLRTEGFAVEWVWKHGYYRSPTSAYEPHLELDEAVRASVDPVVWGNYAPGDHRYCTCALLPVLTPTNQEVAA